MPSLQPVCEIYSLLDISRSAVNGTIAKWKHLATTVTQPRNGRPHKVTERGRQVLRHKIRQLSADSITAGFKISSGINISTNTMLQELHGTGFHGRAPPVGAMCRNIYFRFIVGGFLSLFNSSAVKTRQEAGLKPKCSVLATGHMGACSKSELNWCPIPEYFCTQYCT